MKIRWHEEKRKLSELSDYDRNPRRMTQKAFDKLVESIKQNGYHGRILINTDGTIIGGHQRKKALIKAGYSPDAQIEVLAPDRPLTQEEFDRINIQDNLPYGEYDFDALANSFDMDTLINWGMPESWLDDLDFGVDDALNEEQEDEIPDEVEPIAKYGDLWQLGNHRLLCGDATSTDEVDRLLGGAKVDMVFTDPPYGIDEETDRVFSSRTRLAMGGKFKKIEGDKDTDCAFNSWRVVQSLGVKLQVFWGANHYADRISPSPSWIVWDKRVEEKEQDVNSDCELAWASGHNKIVRIFRHKWKGIIKDSECGEKRVHPTQKPVALAEWCFENYGSPKTVLDVFGGSGSTLIACEKTARTCFMMEIDPHYCDIIINRWQEYSGKKAELVRKS